MVETFIVLGKGHQDFPTTLTLVSTFGTSGSLLLDVETADNYRKFRNLTSGSGRVESLYSPSVPTDYVRRLLTTRGLKRVNP